MSAGILPPRGKAEMSEYAEGISSQNPLKFASAESGKRIIEMLADQIGSRAKELLPRR